MICGAGVDARSTQTKAIKVAPSGDVLGFKEMVVEIKAARMLICHAAWLRDTTGNPATMDVSMAKAHATEMAIRVVNEAVQIYGGYGLLKDYPLERLYREARAPAIHEGTSEIQRPVIPRHLLQEQGRDP
jgi:alkylation response protein AidB-like acyl-CoA dehydrogenase